MFSQVGQDEWVASLFPQGYKGYFMDVGCYEPYTISNTAFLENNGWDGVGFDIIDRTESWKVRKAKFIQADVTKCDFSQYEIPKLIDYLSLDIDGIGDRCLTMKRLLEFGFEFKSITIEHELYLGEEYNQRERIPQRLLLSTAGYKLLFPDVRFDKNKFEDWWINPKYL